MYFSKHSLCFRQTNIVCDSTHNNWLYASIHSTRITTHKRTMKCLHINSMGFKGVQNHWLNISRESKNIRKVSASFVSITLYLFIPNKYSLFFCTTLIDKLNI